MSDAPAIDRGGGPSVRLRFDIAYDGTAFAGWAVQAGQRTVAGVLDEALSTVFRVSVRLFAAGRTDTGVHATGQVAHADVPVEALVHVYPRARTDPAGRSVATGESDAAGRSAGGTSRPTARGTTRENDAEFGPLVRRLARFLPPDVRVRGIVRAASGFDARFSAVRRHYAYRLSTAPYGVEPQLSRYVTAWPRPLDVGLMASASRTLLGLHDFAAFCRRRDGATTIRELQRFDWTRDGDAVTAHVTADAFCWSMVRSLVGAVLAVGEHRRDAQWCAALLNRTERSSAFAAAPACGLTLVGVDYPPDDELAARVLITRDIRVRE